MRLHPNRRRRSSRFTTIWDARYRAEANPLALDAGPATARISEPTPEERAKIEARFIWFATIAAVLLTAVPAIYAQIAAPHGSSYLGFEYNTDDHMVYSAWMRQAMGGHFFFDNRFTTDPQPGLTVHLYFWILGLIAKVTGIPLAANLARLFFTGLFVPLLYRLVRRVSSSVFVTRLAIALTVFGGGLGFLVWHNFGREIVLQNTAGQTFGNAMGGRLPIDVWQPEAFVFPSMLTNSLFMVSLCLILVVFQSFLDARDGWKPALWGGLALGVLMNIHSYDVLMIGFTMVGFLVMQFAAKDMTRQWLVRGLVIGTCVAPAALWFVHVLQSDAVFQARAATPTYSANFKQVVFGYILMFLLALPGLFLRFKALRPRIGLGLISALIAVLFFTAIGPDDAYFLSPGLWVVVVVIGLGALVLLASEDDRATNLLLSWAVMGLIALYFPALFQRKLAMGLSIPWAILATLGFAELVKGRDRNARNLATILVILLLSGTSIFWITRREPYLIRNDVSSTTVHPVFLSRDEQEILKLLNKVDDKSVVVAMPGVAAQLMDSGGQPVPDEFATPIMPDLNSIASGLAGLHTYAGHWSETPDYNKRRGLLTTLFSQRMSDRQRHAVLNQIGATYVIQPTLETYGPSLHALHFELADLSGLGDKVYSGNQFQLIRLRP